MSKLASKLNKRIMAAVLSVAMVMSNMTVYASEFTAPQANNAVDEVADAEDTSVTPDSATTSDESTETGAVVGETNGETADAPDDETTGAVTGEGVQTPNTGEEESSDADKVVTVENPLENDEEVKNEEEIVADKLEDDQEVGGEKIPTYDADKTVDVWDFGAADLGETVNNMLTA